ncbi:MAG: hypothetical protein M1423_00045, partial [Acidobacteria bacterium]|nr:hypothetical protein [Acidobacteriota bacterium]
MFGPMPLLETLNSETLPLREKQNVALASVLAAAALTALKFGVGLSTGSLGVLSDGAHSGLDLIAAGVTYLLGAFVIAMVTLRIAQHEHPTPYRYSVIALISALSWVLPFLYYIMPEPTGWEAVIRSTGLKTAIAVVAWRPAVVVWPVAALAGFVAGNRPGQWSRFLSAARYVQ